MTNQDQPTNNTDFIAVSPDQSDLFEVPPTNLEISHDDAAGMSEAKLETAEAVTANTSVFAVSKAKIAAALVIVAAAGYLAYWVQEPVQVKTDVINSDTTANTVDSETNSTMDENNAALASDSLEAAVAANDEDTLTTDIAVNEEAVVVKNVDLGAFGFEPAVLKIEKGVTVKWTNTSNDEQTIIGSISDGESFTSQTLQPGESYEYLFENDVEVEYYSTLNPAVKATITVGTGDQSLSSAEAEDSTTIDTLDSVTAELVTEPTVNNTTDNSEMMELKPAADEKPVTEAQKASAALEDVAMKGAAPNNQKQITKTGPEDILYLVGLGVVLYFNRHKLLQAIKK